MSTAITIDSEAIIEARVQGESIRSISKRLGCSVGDINDCLDRFAKITISANLRVHTLALELERLDRLQRTFESIAETGDVQAAALVTKIIERRCIMLGIAAPPRVDPHLIAQQAPPVQNSTERIRAAIDRIRAMPSPEVERRLKEIDGGEEPADGEAKPDLGPDQEPEPGQ